MTAQAIDPAAAGDEFHPIAVRLAEDVTDVTCAGCGFAEHTGTGLEGATPHGGDHAAATGHTVTERHSRVTVISERPARKAS